MAPLPSPSRLAVFLFLAGLLAVPGLATAKKSAPFAAEIARLQRRLAHAAPGSAEAYKLKLKIDTYRAAAKGKPRPDNPGEFARILAEMKIPADRSAPEYAPGYQRTELARARARRRFQTLGAPLPWIERGPGNVAGRARGIVVDPDDVTHNTWFIASVGGGVWKTTNGGASWTWLTPDFPTLQTSALAMAPSNHDVIYAGTGESFYSVDVLNGNGILKSIDRGQTWTALASTVNHPGFNNVARLLVDPTNPDVVIAATTQSRYKESLAPRSSIFKSIDGGTSWTEVFASTTIGTLGRVKKLQQLVADPTNFDILYATVDEAGILKSTNRGDTWTFINTGITDFTGRFELAVSPVDPNRLFAAAEGASNSELWISTNAGATWSLTTDGSGDPNWLGGQGWYDNAIVCHPTNVNVVYVGGITLWRITIAGTSRTTTNLGSGVHSDQHGLQIINAGGGNWRILNTNDGGVSVSTLEDTGWSQLPDGMVTTQFYGADKSPGASAYVGGTQDNGTWQSPSDPGALTPWTHVIGGDGYETSWHFNDPTRLIGGFQFNGLMRSLDGGATWTSAQTSVSPAGLIDNGSANAPFITKIAKTNANPDFLCAVGRRGVWRSLDFGGTWSLSSISTTTWGSGAPSSFLCVRISRANPNVVWAGARMDATSRIHVSTDGGVTFNAVPNYTTVTMGGISGLATHPTDANTAYVLFSFAARPKILKTTDAGATWTDITGFTGGSPSTNGFPDVAVYDLQVFSNDPNRLWAATEIGLVESLDGGATWALASNGLPNVGIWQLIQSEDEIVAATHGRGIWSVTMPELTVGQTFRPLIDQLFQAPSGALNADLNLRSVYDSTQVWVDGAHFATIAANVERQDEQVEIPVAAGGTKQVELRAWKGGVLHPSIAKSIAVFAPREPVVTYVSDFEAANSDFTGPLFRIGTQAGFVGSAIHSPHPYANNTNPVYTLTVPIRVALSGATVAFDEEALVEPGEPGSQFGDADFYDYVVVEGTLDGKTWTPIAPGWDCRAYPEWEAAFTANAPSPALLRRRTIDLRDVFNAGDLVLLRFRLYADAGVTGWGWMIDNLEIQGNPVTDVGPRAGGLVFALDQNHPNPVRGRTSFQFSLPAAAPARLSLYDVSGRLVRRLADGPHPAGPRTVEWDGRGEDGSRVPAGVYFCELASGTQRIQRKLVVAR